MQRRDARAGCPWRRAIASPAARTAPSARRDSPRGPSRSTTRARATRTTSTGRTRRRRSTARVETRSMRTPARTPRPSSTRLRRACALGGGWCLQIANPTTGPRSSQRGAHDLIDRASVRRTTACRAPTMSGKLAGDDSSGSRIRDVSHLFRTTLGPSDAHSPWRRRRARARSPSVRIPRVAYAPRAPPPAPPRPPPPRTPPARPVRALVKTIAWR